MSTNANKRAKPTNFTLVQGSDFYFYHRIKDSDTGDPIDITDYTFEMKIRKSYEDDVLITLSEGNGRITRVDNTDGLILCHISAADTGTLPIDIECSYTNPPTERWVYDLEADANVFPPGKFKTLYGEIIAYAEVTK